MREDGFSAVEFEAMDERGNIFITTEQYETAEKNGISKAHVWQRVNVGGWGIERAITQPIKKKNKEKTAWAKKAQQYGVSKDLFYARAKSGWDFEKAATTPPMPRKEACRIASQKKRTVLSLEEEQTAIENGIPIGTVRMRIKQYGWSKERAITEPVNTQFRSRGREYDATS